MSAEDVKTAGMKAAVESVGEVLSELIEPGPEPTTEVNVSEEEFRRLMRENGITAGSGLVLPRALIIPASK